MTLETLIMVCSYSVPWELDKRDMGVIKKHQNEPVNVVVSKLWEAAR